MIKQKKQSQKKIVAVQVVESDYNHLLSDIKERIQTAQYRALRSVNKELVALYWDIGRMISERQKDARHGDAIVEQLARDLRHEIPGTSGFSRRNIFYMREFYATYSVFPKVQPLVAQIAWTHNLIIMQRCKKSLEREYYIRMAAKEGWSKNILIHHIENQSYERTLRNQTNFEKTLPSERRIQAKLAVRDEYTFDFLELKAQHSERKLERAILSKIEIFLRNVGGLFAFIGSQYRLEVDGKEYFIDLLLYHRSLRCLVAVELKVGEFEPEFVGKMQFYLAALDNLVRVKGERPSIGIILCKEKHRLVVEYALQDVRKPIGVSTYRVVRQLPVAMQGQLPSVREIAKLMEDI